MLVCYSLYSNTIYRPSAKRRLHEYHKANGNMLRFYTYPSNYQYKQIIETSYDDEYDAEIDLQLSSIFLTIGIIGFLIYFLIKYLNKRKD